MRYTSAQAPTRVRRSNSTYNGAMNGIHTNKIRVRPAKDTVTFTGKIREEYYAQSSKAKITSYNKATILF